MRTQEYSDFFKRLHKKAAQRAVPIRVMFELTYRCNFNCGFCYIPESYREKPEIAITDIQAILDQLAVLGTLYLGFTGGEPFMRKDIMDVLWYAKNKGFEIVIHTNGALINNKIIKELVRLRPNKLDIALQAFKETTFKRISGVQGMFGKVMENINILHNKGIALGLKTCVLKENVKELSQIQEFARSIGAFHKVDDLLSPRLDGSLEPYQYRAATWKKKESISTCEEQIKQNSAEQEYVSAGSSLFSCGVGKTQAAIAPWGELKPCLMIDSPKFKILSSSLKAAWKKLQEFTNNIRPDEYYQCRNCELKPYCKWCPARGWLSAGKFTACDPQMRLYAQKQRIPLEL